MSDDLKVFHIEGVEWAEAPLPRWLHRCRMQSVGVKPDMVMGRCACGAMFVRDGWIGKNETRRHRLMERFGLR